MIKRLKEILSIVFYSRMVMTPAITGIINEEWHTIPGYINFQISNIGNMRDSKGKPKLPTNNGDAYLRVSLPEFGITKKQANYKKCVFF